jgi:hypothetical protein
MNDADVELKEQEELVYSYLYRGTVNMKMESSRWVRYGMRTDVDSD